MILDGSLVNPAREQEVARAHQLRERAHGTALASGGVIFLVALSVALYLLLPFLARIPGITLLDPFRYAVAALAGSALLGYGAYWVAHVVIDGWWDRTIKARGLLRPLRPFLDDFGPLRDDVTNEQMWAVLGQREDLDRLRGGQTWDPEAWSERDDVLGAAARAHLQTVVELTAR